MRVPDQLLGAVGVSCAAILAIELLLWLVIYRKPSFRLLKERLLAQNKKLEGMKASSVANSKVKAKEKKEKRLENSMKMETGRQFGIMKIQQFVIAFIFSLCQAGIRQALGMWLQLGPNRQVQGLIAANNQMVGDAMKSAR